MTSLPTLLFLEEYDSGAFQRTAEGVWTSDFYRVGDGFSVRAIALRPKFGLPDVAYQWLPHAPTEQQRQRLNREMLARTSKALEIRIFAYHWQAYGMNIDRPKHKRVPKSSCRAPWYTLENHLWAVEK
jgi:hypothetical protein